MGLGDNTAGYGVLFGGYGGSLLVGFFWVKQVYVKAMQLRRDAIDKIHEHDFQDGLDEGEDPKEYLEMLKMLFSRFDIRLGRESRGCLLLIV